MKKPLKAALLSALVYPGAGHLFLRRYPIAFAFIGAFSYLLISLIAPIYEVSQKVMLQISSGELALNLEAISQSVSLELAQQPQQYNWLSIALVMIWGFAAFDAYRLAKKL